MPQPATISVPGLAQLTKDLARIEPELRKELRNRFRELIQPVADDAKSRASWSSRIPNAIRISLGAKNMSLTAKAVDAPHAKAYEGLAKGSGSRSGFRHPVYGRDVWVSQSTRPFLLPAVQAHSDEVYRKVEEILDDITGRLGWGGL